MGRPFIVLGDQTDHGGQVIEASGMSFVHGRRIARVGDKVTCPKRGHGHTTVIVTGDPTMVVDGQPVARHGDQCACGAILLASQGVAGAGSASAPAAPQRPNVEAEVGKGLAVQQGLKTRPKRHANVSDRRASYGVRFRAIDLDTHEILPNCNYTLVPHGGSPVTGKTDAQGYTQPIESPLPEPVTVQFSFNAPSGKTLDLNAITDTSPLGNDLKLAGFDTIAETTSKTGSTVRSVSVNLNNRAATRQSIILQLRRAGHQFQTRSQWKAKPTPARVPLDWNYHGIALHHAGNSYSCGANSAELLHTAETTDYSKFGQLSYHYAVGCDGVIYEALDIRHKGSHIAQGNTGVVGIVMLADLSERGEAYEQEYRDKSVWQKIRGAPDWLDDQLDVNADHPTDMQIKSLLALVHTLKEHFRITALGGHREYQHLATHDGRACPGTGGMSLVKMLRRELLIEAPK